MNDDLSALIHRLTVAGGFANTVAIAEEAFEMGRREGPGPADGEEDMGGPMPWEGPQPIEKHAKMWKGRDWVPLDAAISELQFWQKRDWQHSRARWDCSTLSASPLPGREEIARVISAETLAKAMNPALFDSDDLVAHMAASPTTVEATRRHAIAVASEVLERLSLSTPPTEGGTPK